MRQLRLSKANPYTPVRVDLNRIPDKGMYPVFHSLQRVMGDRIRRLRFTAVTENRSVSGEDMEHRIGIRLLFGALLLSTCLAVTGSGQQKRGFVFDTGMVTLGPNQILRISGDGVDQDDAITLRFRRIQYSQGPCNAGVCKHSISLQITSPPTTLTQGETATIDIPNNSFGVRAAVLSNSQDVRVTAQIVDQTTGAIVAIWVPQGSPVVSKE